MIQLACPIDTPFDPLIAFPWIAPPRPMDNLQSFTPTIKLKLDRSAYFTNSKPN
jgi:hypothetical protein